MVISLRVVMIGADRSVHGGVSAVVNNYYGAGLDKEVNLLYIGTMVDGGKFCKLIQAFGAYLRFLAALPGMDILHVNMASDASYYRKKIFIDTAALFRRKILIHAHGGNFMDFYYEKNNENGRASIRKTLNKAQVFVVLSNEWAKFFRPIVKKEKTLILQNAVPVPDEPKTSYDDHNLLFLGRLCKEKGISELLDVIPLVAEKYPDVKLYLGGVWEDDTLKSRAEDLKKYVRYLGWIGEKKKKAYMKKCSVFVLPTYFEGQPVSLLEAMAEGMAVISTDVGGIPQIVKSGSEGILLAPKDTESLYESICSLLGDSELKKEYGSRARERIIEHYNIEDSVRELVKIYLKMMKAG